jgi:hypothetical protein
MQEHLSASLRIWTMEMAISIPFIDIIDPTGAA